MTDIRTSPSGQKLGLAAALIAYGSQLAWAINASTGSDLGPGTPALPLRTMAEFNARMFGVRVPVAQALQLVGDVLDEPLMLSGTRYPVGGSLTVSGTRTALASGCTISVVTALGGNPIGTSFPWQLTTAGVNWTTTPAGAQIRFSNASIGWIAEVVDANNVIVSPVSVTGATAVPTTALTFSVETLSQALPPFVNGLSSVSATSATVILQDLSLQQGRANINGIGLDFNACEVVSTASVSWDTTVPFRWLRCRHTCANAALLTMRAAPAAWSSLGCTHVGASGAQSASVAVRGGQAVMQVATMLGMKLTTLDNCFLQIGSGMHFRNTVATGSSGLVTLFNMSRIYVLNSVNGSINGAIGNSGVMFDTRSGEFAYNGSAVKPTATGTVGSEVRLGNAATLSYATIGSGRRTLTLDAIPPTTIELTLAGYAAWGASA